MNRNFRLGKNSSFFEDDAKLGGINGFSLKNKKTDREITDPRTA